MLTIIGLGNTVPEYAKTRHNIGEHMVSAFVKAEGIDLTPKKLFLALMGKCKVSTKSVQFILPQTLMNLSGKTLKAMHPDSTSKDDYENILVIHDDIDMALGVTKMVFDRNSGGHKGIESIDKALKTKKYYRLKIGVIPTDEEGNMRKPGPEKMQNFVLGTFNEVEWAVLKKTTKKVKEIIETFVSEGPVKAMEMSNRK
jgi:PTH1 family peptidyl-tRNA hydrolase